VLGRNRARLLVLGAFGAYFALLSALGGYSRWSRLGVSSSTTWFGDLRGVTSAWECTRRGIAVLPINPCDPFRRPANYPRLWLLPSHLGLGQGDTMALGFVVGAAFLAAAVMVVPQRATLGLGAAYAVFACSPAAMLGVERGNVDLTLFALVVFAVLVVRRGTGGLLVSAGSVLLAAVLKLFPIFSVGFLARRSGRARAAAVAVVAVFGVYVLALFHQIRQEVSAVPQSDLFAYGVRRVSEWISAAAGESVSRRLTSYRAWDVVLVVVALAVGVVLARRLAPPVRALSAGHARDLDLFWAGACVYVFTYPVARSFDYQLVFLLPVVPQLVRWARSGSWFATLTIATAVVVTWLDEWTRPPLLGRLLGWWDRTTQVGPDSLALPVVVLAQLLLFVELVAWLVATAPLPRRRSLPAGAPA